MGKDRGRKVIADGEGGRTGEGPPDPGKPPKTMLPLLSWEWGGVFRANPGGPNGKVGGAIEEGMGKWFTGWTGAGII